MHQIGKVYEPKASNINSGSTDLCFIIKTSINSAVKHLNKCGVAIIEGPVARIGAICIVESVSFRDPDGSF